MPPSIPLSELKEFQIFRFRNREPSEYCFIDCKAFLEEQILRLCAFETLPFRAYSAISHVWNGLSAKPSPLKFDYFKVVGAQGLGKINLEILRQACLLSILQDAPYMWLDCICIDQRNEQDQIWHIERMAEIYQSCKVCIIIPGGLERLLRLRMRQEADWVTRHWTMLEAVLPLDAVCLFWWSLGPGTIDNAVKIEMVEPNSQGLVGAAHCSFQSLLDKETVDYAKEIFTDAAGQIHTLSTSQFNGSCTAITGTENERKIIRALASVDNAEREHAIWASIFIRESSNPVDSILSHMAFLGITLDTASILRSKHPRFAATIKLAQKYLAVEGRAHWLSFLAANEFATFSPIYQGYSNKTYYDKQWPSLDDRACTLLYEAEEGENPDEFPSLPVGNPTRFLSNKRCETLSIRLRHAPKGHMDDYGYLTIRALCFFWGGDEANSPFPLTCSSYDSAAPDDYAFNLQKFVEGKIGMINLGPLVKPTPSVSVLTVWVVENSDCETYRIISQPGKALESQINGSGGHPSWMGQMRSITLGGPRKCHDLWTPTDSKDVSKFNVREMEDGVMDMMG